MAHTSLDIQVRLADAAAAADAEESPEKEKADELYEMISEQDSFDEFMEQYSDEKRQGVESRIRFLCAETVKFGPMGVTHNKNDKINTKFFEILNDLHLPDDFFSLEPEEHEEPIELEPGESEEPEEEARSSSRPR